MDGRHVNVERVAIRFHRVIQWRHLRQQRRVFVVAAAAAGERTGRYHVGATVINPLLPRLQFHNNNNDSCHRSNIHNCDVQTVHKHDTRQERIDLSARLNRPSIKSIRFWSSVWRKRSVGISKWMRWSRGWAYPSLYRSESGVNTGILIVVDGVAALLLLNGLNVSDGVVVAFGRLDAGPEGAWAGHRALLSHVDAVDAGRVARLLLLLARLVGASDAAAGDAADAARVAAVAARCAHQYRSVVR